MFKVFDKVGETSTSTGVGDIALSGALTGHRTFSLVGDTTLIPYHYAAVDGSGNETGEWETGIGRYNSGANSITRYIPLAGSSAVPVNFSAGNKVVVLSALSVSMDSSSGLLRELETASPGFDAKQLWEFVSSVESWTCNGTVTWDSAFNGNIIITDTQAAAKIQLTSPAISIDGSKYSRVKMLISRLAGVNNTSPDYNASIAYSTAGHSFNTAAYVKTIPLPLPNEIGDEFILEFDMNSLTIGGNDWVTNTITGIRLYLGSNSGTTDQFRIQWIAIGKNAPVSALTQYAHSSASGLMKVSAAADKTVGDFVPSSAGFVYANASGVVNSLPVCGPADFWVDDYFSNNSSARQFWSGAAISSGTISGAQNASTILGLMPGGIQIRSSTTANSGYRFQSNSLVADFFSTTGVARKFQCSFVCQASSAVRAYFGAHDTNTITAPVDGAYFQILSGVLRGACSFNSSTTSTTAGVSIVNNTLYLLDFEVAADASSVRFRVYSGTSPTPILDETIITNIPNTSARVFGWGMVGVYDGTPGVATDVMVLNRMGFGTVNGYNSARGPL